MKNLYLLFTIAVILIVGCSNNDNPPTAQSITQHSTTTSLAKTLPDPNTPPTVIVSASTSEIFPPNEKMVTVIFSGTITNYDPASYTLTDEYGKIFYSGTLTGTSFSVALDLQAQRDGNDKNGRTYTFTVTAVGSSTISAATTVVVLHEKKKNDHHGSDDDENDDNND